MRENQLRIGNFFISPITKDEVLTVTGIRHTNTYGYMIYYTSESGVSSLEHADLLFPIPITEEWILRLGFESYLSKNLYFNNLHCIELIGTVFYFKPFCTIDAYCYIEIKSVDQLQNFYFALTGEELTLTSTKNTLSL